MEWIAHHPQTGHIRVWSRIAAAARWRRRIRWPVSTPACATATAWSNSTPSCPPTTNSSCCTTTRSSARPTATVPPPTTHGSNSPRSTRAPGTVAQFAGTRLPTLADAAQRCARDGIAANIEIKPCPGRDEITGTLVASGASTLVARANAAAAVVVFVRGAGRGARRGAVAATWHAVRTKCRRTGCASCASWTACRCMRATGI